MTQFTLPSLLRYQDDLKAAIPAGSGTYYAIRQSPRQLRPLWMSLYAWRYTLERSWQNRDSYAARAKLLWWEDEMVNRFPDRPTHPLACALAECLQNQISNRIEVSIFSSLIHGYLSRLDQARLLSFEALQHDLDAVEGNFAALVANLSNLSASKPLDCDEWARPLGRALALAKEIRDVGFHAQAGRIRLPVDELQRFRVRASDILTKHENDRETAFVAMMDFQTTRAQEALTKALDNMPKAQRSRQIILRIKAKLASALLHEIRMTHYRVLNQRIALTPLRKFWIAWRTAHSPCCHGRFFSSKNSPC
jgi:phytoene synthase